MTALAVGPAYFAGECLGYVLGIFLIYGCFVVIRNGYRAVKRRLAKFN